MKWKKRLAIVYTAMLVIYLVWDLSTNQKPHDPNELPRFMTPRDHEGPTPKLARWLYTHTDHPELEPGH